MDTDKTTETDTDTDLQARLLERDREVTMLRDVMRDAGEALRALVKDIPGGECSRSQCINRLIDIGSLLRARSKPTTL